jgi:ADP-ribosyl-[dinitrogen reductase] hydrolase
MTTRYTHISDEVARRAAGSLLGQAVADALGAPYEFHPGGLYDLQNPNGPAFRPTTGSFGWEAGEFTDDTQMAYLLGEILIRKEMDRDLIFSSWSKWAETAADVGTTTRRALSMPSRPRKWPEDARGNGNGAVMRVSPVGIMGYRKGWLWTEWAAREQALLTHPDARTVESSVITAVVIARMIQKEQPLAEMVEYAITNHVSWDMRNWAKNYFLSEEGINLQAEPSVTNGQGHVCLLQALQSIDQTAGYVAAVSRAINIGGDADTVGAVTGAIAGAIYGIDQIPHHLLQQVHGNVPEYVDRRDLEQMALKLAAGKIGTASISTNSTGNMMYNL